MLLSKSDYNLFLSSTLKFYFFIARKNKLVDQNLSFEEFKELDNKVKKKCRDLFYLHPELLNEYDLALFENHTPQELEVLSRFKKKVLSKFLILKHKPDHSIFVDVETKIVYFVKSLSQPLEFMLNEPIAYVSTALLPFNDVIIFDGFLDIHSAKNPIPEWVIENYIKIYRKAKKEKTFLLSLI